MWTVKNGVAADELEKLLNTLAAEGFVIKNVFYTAKTFSVVAFRDKTLREMYDKRASVRA